MHSRIHANFQHQCKRARLFYTVTSETTGRDAVNAVRLVQPFVLVNNKNIQILNNKHSADSMWVWFNYSDLTFLLTYTAPLGFARLHTATGAVIHVFQ